MKDEGMLYTQISLYIKFWTMMSPELALQTDDANEDLFLTLSSKGIYPVSISFS